MSHLPWNGIPFKSIVERFEPQKIKQAVKSIAVVRVCRRSVVLKEAIKVIYNAFVDELSQFSRVFAIQPARFHILQQFHVLSEGNGFLKLRKQ